MSWNASRERAFVRDMQLISGFAKAVQGQDAAARAFMRAVRVAEPKGGASGAPRLKIRGASHGGAPLVQAGCPARPNCGISVSCPRGMRFSASYIGIGTMVARWKERSRHWTETSGA